MQRDSALHYTGAVEDTARKYSEIVYRYTQKRSGENKFLKSLRNEIRNENNIPRERLFARSANYNVNWYIEARCSFSKVRSRAFWGAQKRNRPCPPREIGFPSTRGKIFTTPPPVWSPRTKTLLTTPMRRLWHDRLFDKRIIKSRIIGGSWIIVLCEEERFIDLRNISFRNISHRGYVSRHNNVPSMRFAIEQFRQLIIQGSQTRGPRNAWTGIFNRATLSRKLKKKKNLRLFLSIDENVDSLGQQ